MEGSSPAAQLPEDILLKIFALFNLQELARVMGICKPWRHAALHHPKFYRHAVLTSTTPSSVAFFIARLTSSPAKTWDVAVLVHEPFAELETVVFPTVASRLDDVERLTINVHASHAAAVFELLRGSAASLNHLHLRFYSGSDEEVVMLPEDILARVPPGQEIRTLLIQNVDIPERLPPALASIRHLTFAKWFPQSRTTLHDLARAFPAALDVTLCERVFDRDVVDPSDWPEQWNTLAFLSLAIGRGGLRNTLPQLSLGHTAHLSTMRTGQTALEKSLSHLVGPFDMHFKKIARGRFGIILTCRSSGRVRSFYECASSWPTAGSPPHRLLSQVVIIDHLLSLTVPETLWNLLVPRLSECTRLSDLTLLISSSDWISDIFPDDWTQTGPLFPNVHTLTIAGWKRKLTVVPEDVWRFVSEGLWPQSPLRLALQGIVWHGPARIPPTIDSVQLIDGKKLLVRSHDHERARWNLTDSC